MSGNAILSPSQQEDLRFAVREALWVAQSVELTADMLARRIQRTKLLDFEFSAGDVVRAAEFLVDLGQAKKTGSELGGTNYYRATAAGVLAYERRQ